MGLEDEFSALSDLELNCEIEKCDQFLKYADTDKDTIETMLDRLDSLNEELAQRERSRVLVQKSA